MSSNDGEITEESEEQESEEKPSVEAEVNEVEIYLAEDLRNPRKNTPQHLGSVPQDYMQEEGRLILRPLTEVDRKIVSVFDDGYRFSELWADRPHRGVYILGDDTDNIIEGKTPYIDDVPALQRFYLKSDGLLHIDLDNLKKSNKESAEETMKPRLIFKVLRGSRAIVYKDGTGRFASTGDLVNAVIEPGETNHSLSTLFLTMNSPIISYYLQRIVYSGSTETARNLDAPYLKNIPIPELNESQADLLGQVSDYLLFTNQYNHDRNVGERVENVANLFSRISNALIADLFYDFDDMDLWDILEGELSNISYEEWADERFAKGTYPVDDAKTMWNEVSEIHGELDIEAITEDLSTVESDERIERVEDVLNE